MDVMFLEEKAVLHVVDTATHFFVATFLDAHAAVFRQSVDGIWLPFVTNWCLICTGYPKRPCTDQESVFKLEW